MSASSGNYRAIKVSADAVVAQCCGTLDLVLRDHVERLVAEAFADAIRGGLDVPDYVPAQIASRVSSRIRLYEIVEVRKGILAALWSTVHEALAIFRRDRTGA